VDVSTTKLGVHTGGKASGFMSTKGCESRRIVGTPDSDTITFTVMVPFASCLPGKRDGAVNRDRRHGTPTTQQCPSRRRDNPQADDRIRTSRFIALIDAYIAQRNAFVCGMSRTIYQSIRNVLKDHRHQFDIAAAL